jgi:hypothetical protein
MQPNTNIFVALWKFKGFRVFCGVFFAAVIFLSTSFYTSTQILSSNNINYPTVDHLHFRMQYVYHGVSENFADSKYQEPYEKNQCSGGLTDSPIHFHDGVDQIVHVHWKQITGGQVLKYYGLNRIGGVDSFLGYRWDKLKQTYQLSPVNIQGKLLPLPKSDDKIYVYSGDKDSFTKRAEDDWNKQTLETFFGKKSQLSAKASIFGSISAQAQSILSGEIKEVTDQNTQLNELDQTQSQPTEDELKQINNFLGNVAIFVQKGEPTEEEVAAKFNKLQPLSLSTCGG